eukprot:6483733-Amphidinium_carterae.1
MQVMIQHYDVTSLTGTCLSNTGLTKLEWTVDAFKQRQRLPTKSHAVAEEVSLQASPSKSKRINVFLSSCSILCLLHVCAQSTSTRNAEHVVIQQNIAIILCQLVLVEEAIICLSQLKHTRNDGPHLVLSTTSTTAQFQHTILQETKAKVCIAAY